MTHRKFLGRLAAALMIVPLAGAAPADPLRIAIANFGKHPALNAVVDGFRAAIIYGPASNLIQPAIAAVAATANEARVPVLNTDAGAVRDGLVPVAFTVSYQQIGRGLAIDAVVSDFVAGASLGLLHGAQPTAFVVCHELGRTDLAGFRGHKAGSIEQIIFLTTELGKITSPGIRCVGISLNTGRRNEDDARNAMQDLSRQFDLPVCDPIRVGVDEIVERMLRPRWLSRSPRSRSLATTAPRSACASA